ncbi:TrmH family RNA methyltransferase [Clostridium sp. LBM24168]
MNIIKSRSNLQIKEVKKLKDKKYRDHKGEFLVEGFRFVEEAVKSKFKISMIFINEDLSDKWKEYLKSKNINISFDVKVYYTLPDIFNTISSTDNSQGIIAVVKNTNLKMEKKDGFYVLADKIQDPGNMGTIIRSAHASGALGVILTKGTVDVYNEKTLRSTMGSIFYMPVLQDYDFKIVKSLKEDGFRIVAGTIDASMNFYDVDLKSKVILAVGNEGNGLSNEVKNMADVKVKIPMPGNAESLNASVAVSIMMFEVVRQKLN